MWKCPNVWSTEYEYSGKEPDYSVWAEQNDTYMCQSIIIIIKVSILKYCIPQFISNGSKPMITISFPTAKNEYAWHKWCKRVNYDCN